jgi:translation elongation factor EF-G
MHLLPTCSPTCCCCCITQCEPYEEAVVEVPEQYVLGSHAAAAAAAAAVQVITREVDGHKCEPYEEAVVEVPEQYVGGIVELFAQRKGEMVDMQPSIQVGMGPRSRSSNVVGKKS